MLTLAACGGSGDEDAYTVGVTFPTTKELPLEEGDPVRVEGEEVGEVASIEDGRLRSQTVGLRIEDRDVVPLPLDSTFRIGPGVLEVDPGRSRSTAREGDIFPGANTYPVP